MIGMILAMTAATANLDWRDYANVRYGYFTCYPARLLKAGPESDAGDGRVASSADGAELRLSGHYLPNGPTGGDARKEASEGKREILKSGGIITYAVDRPGWSVFSGRKGSSIVWVKVMVRDDRVATVWLTYPVGRAALYSAVPAQLNRCSNMGTAPF